ncbi:MAG: thioredoxin family protein [Muribaculaceae bacterium]|nr:thioredoxin family protein [Muribaculaceae bacterium]MDE6542250.1 thioredoxin family protein [Muribaculaceae bacterium]
MNYQSLIGSTGTVLVEFYASWCPHCRRMMPIVEQVKELLGDQVPVYQFDIDKEQEAASEAGVESVPTFIIYRNGREMWRQSGEIEGEVLLRTVDKYLENGYE